MYGRWRAATNSRAHIRTSSELRPIVLREKWLRIKPATPVGFFTGLIYDRTSHDRTAVCPTCAGRRCCTGNGFLRSPGDEKGLRETDSLLFRAEYGRGLSRRPFPSYDIIIIIIQSIQCILLYFRTSIALCVDGVMILPVTHFIV